MSEYALRLDVRSLVPKDRHPKIFGALDQLNSGQKLELTNDHDPKPLYYQIMAERKGEFEWEYLEEGPDVWRVAIIKT